VRLGRAAECEPHDSAGPDDPAERLAASPPPGAAPEALALWTPSPASGRSPKVAGSLTRRVGVGPVLARIRGLLLFPAVGEEGRDRCGPISLHYPAVFVP